ncbi:MULTISPECIES: P-loop ATPase, Sll1717 family [unclassified Brevundimonas]|uniref:P-loop ATPase, Sll1717 family n=1 Tax=unclassified Brevundimonas TaxID=2622653 RepID=UPI0025C5E586|nr:MULTISPECIES: hypothetical protein [unclassified Brevundimonas]
MTPKAKNPIQLRQGLTIGQPAAEDDDEFLFPAFFENYAYAEMSSVSSPKFLLLGRTGTGKTAILRCIEKQKDYVVKIDPAELSLQYISNSDIINFFEKNGVKLDLFYQMLWRHVIASELIKKFFGLDDEAKTKSFYQKIATGFSAKRKRAIEYMQSFGSEFWMETDERISQVTTKFEKELKAGAGIDDTIILGTQGSTTYSEEQTKQFAYRAQKVVDNVKLQQLSEVIDWLDADVFTDPKKQYYVLIDDLDLNFSFGDTKLWLIRALIETCKKFRKISNVKIVISIRTDLLERVFETTRDEGFQEEKYKGNICKLMWLPGELKEIVNRRLSESIRRQYSNSNIGFSEVFPEKINQSDSFSYLVQRTLHRPRDIIAYVNECIVQSVGSDRISISNIKKAEEPYSYDRFNALRDEWLSHFPLLGESSKILHGRPRKFSLSQITKDDIEMIMLELATNDKHDQDRLASKIPSSGNFKRSDINKFKIELVYCLYRTGIVGLKLKPESKLNWSHIDSVYISREDISEDTTIYPHPMLWRKLSINTKEFDSEIQP